METIGIHCLVEMYDCPRERLDDEMFVTKTLRRAVDHGLAELLKEVSHHFHPQGVTAVGLLAESHIAIHTWPEYGYAAADIFTCGNRATPEAACHYLIRAFQAGRHSMMKLGRGLEAADSTPSLHADPTVVESSQLGSG